jgi:hypothetical protein
MKKSELINKSKNKDKEIIKESKKDRVKKDKKNYWEGLQILPLDLIKKIAYYLTLKEITEIAIEYPTEFSNKSSFWRDKLKNDGYIINDTTFDKWVSYMKGERFFAEFYKYFEKGYSLTGPIESINNIYSVQNKVLEEIEILKGIPPNFPIKEFRTQLNTLQKLINKPLQEWKEMNNIGIDMEFQRNVIEERLKRKQLYVIIPIKFSMNNIDTYEQLLHQIKRSKYFNSIFNGYASFSPIFPRLNNQENLPILVTMLEKLQYLLKTSDILILDSKNYYVYKVNGDIKLIPFNNYLPVEALPFIIKIKTKQDIDSYYNFNKNNYHNIMGFLMKKGNDTYRYRFRRGTRGEKYKELKTEYGTIIYIGEPVKVNKDKINKKKKEDSDDESGGCELYESG